MTKRKMPDGQSALDPVAFRIQRTTDKAYLVVLTSYTQQPVWSRSPKSAMALDTADEARKLVKRLRDRGFAVKVERFQIETLERNPTQPNPTQPTLV